MAFIAMCAEEFSSMMLVGHDPHLSSFASILVSGSTLGSIEMKKSMLALFSLTDMDTPRMRGTLRLLLPPKIANLKF